MGDSPAFQFYPSDYVIGTMLLDAAERGVYVDLLCHQWNVGAIPGDDSKALAKIMRVRERDAKTYWAAISDKFVRGDDGLWRNQRLEAERTKQAEYRLAKAEAGRRGGLAKAKQTPSTASVLLVTNTVAKPSSSSSSSSSSSKNQELTPAQNAGGPSAARPVRFTSPAAWDKKHGHHVGGFCSWVCFPEDVFDEFVRRVMGAGRTEAEATESVRAWAFDVKARWAGQDIPGDSIFDFWRNEWKRTHGSNKPVSSPAFADPLAGLREAERRG